MQNEQFQKSASYLQSQLGTHTAVAKTLGVTPAAYRIARNASKGPSSLMWFATCAAALLRQNDIELPVRNEAGKE